MKTNKPASSKEKAVSAAKNQPKAKITQPVIAQNGEAQPKARRRSE